MREVPEIGDPVPKSANYDSDKALRAYWRLSYRGGMSYRDGDGPEGSPIIHRHDAEDTAPYNRRRLMTNPRNYAKPIIRKYNDFVFRKPALYPNTEDDSWSEFYKNADNKGNEIGTFWSSRLSQAQVDRETYVLVDSTAPSDMHGIESKADQIAQNLRPFLKAIDADQVTWYDDNGDCGLVMQDQSGATIFREYLGPVYNDYNIERKNGDLIVKSVKSEGVAHGYQRSPLVRLRPSFDDLGHSEGSAQSQVGPIADGQRTIANLQSLIAEEVYSNTFTQWTLSGVSQEEAEKGGVTYGAKRLFCLPNPQSSISRIGSDVTQAQSLSDRLREEESAIYQASGISPGDPMSAGAQESGLARSFRFNDLSANLSALARAVQDAANQCLRLIAFGWGYALDGSVLMPNDFKEPEFDAELASTLTLASAPRVPGVIQKNIWSRFAKRNLELDDEEKEILAVQLDDLATTINPFARPPLDSGAGQS